MTLGVFYFKKDLCELLSEGKEVKIVMYRYSHCYNSIIINI